METVVSPPKEQGPDLLLHWDREFGETRWRQAAILSLLLHFVLGGGLIVSSGSAPRAPVQEPPKPRITPLVDPPSQLTQHAPNRAKLSKDITADMLLPTPRAEKGAPSHAAAAPPAPPPKPAFTPPAPARNAKTESAPKVEVAQAPPALTPQIQAQERPPLPPVEKPALAFETPHQVPPSSSNTVNRLAPPLSVTEATRNVARTGSSGGTQVGDAGNDSPLAGLTQSPSPGRPQSNLELLSDPKGVDFKPYLLQVLQTVRRNWFAVYPESAKLGQRGKVAIQFAIGANGRINKVVISTESGARALDRAAVASLSASDPLPPLPADFHGERIVLQFTFLYNMPR